MSREVPAIRGRWLPMSFEAFLAWSGEAYAEWVDGRGIAYPPCTSRHQEVLGWLLMLMTLCVNLGGYGAVYPLRTAMRLSDGRSLRQPDLFFIAHEQRSRMTTYWLDGPADLVVEVISDDSAERDRVEKFAEYAVAGIPELWLVDSRPNAAPIEAFHLTSVGDYQRAAPDQAGCYYSRGLPNFWLDPVWLRQEPLPSPLATMKLIAPAALRASLGDPE